MFVISNADEDTSANPTIRTCDALAAWKTPAAIGHLCDAVHIGSLLAGGNMQVKHLATRYLCVVLPGALLCLAACGVAEPPVEASEPRLAEPNIAEPSGTQEESLSTGPADPEDMRDNASEPPGLAANCSIVQFCNAPGADGTRCLQRGCGRIDAEVECLDEAIRICGAPLCPTIFVESNGNRRDLCNGL
jgi:hypothetical protein